ncbi:MAG: DNA ligase D [Thermoguttaceae bacterium]
MFRRRIPQQVERKDRGLVTPEAAAAYYCPSVETTPIWSPFGHAADRSLTLVRYLQRRSVIEPLPAGDMSLTSYRSKRDFGQTTEPRGGRMRAKRGKWPFVVQCHVATRLHYDFRLALDGVLKSWAVPKGPSLNPTQKRLAVEVEDHPLDYANFEGTIPEGQYGAGAVMLWDRGTWRPDGDPHEGLRRGKLEFHLDGGKLRGGFVLVRTRGASTPKNSWLLIKRQDADARGAADPDILSERAESVKTGRTLDEIAAGIPARRKQKAGTARRSRIDRPRDEGAEQGGSAAAVPGARRAKLPDTFRPQLATLVVHPPEGDDWWHETKLDGYRLALRIDGRKVDLLSRRMQSWTARLPHLVEAATRLPVRAALLDGELVAVEPDGVTNFQSLQTAFRENRGSRLIYYAFDLLHLDGYDLTGCTLEGRKALLAAIVGNRTNAAGPIRYTEHTVGRGPEAFRRACQLGLEGIVSKRRDARYMPGRGTNWLKAKCVRREEFVIGGFTEPEGARKHFGALLLGHYADGSLVYAGRVGAGFDDATLRDLIARLKPLEQPASPFAASTALQARGKGVHWVAPRLVVQVQFRDWTRDRLVRQPSFQGLREDVEPRDVVREEPETKIDVAKGQTRAAPPAPLHIRFTNPGKVLYAGQGITKLDLAHYYAAVADWMLPHVAGRPLTLVRCPEGAGSQCFYQKHAEKGDVEHLRLFPVRKGGKTTRYLIVDDLAGLLSLVQLGALEIHVWGSTVEDIERPNRIVFDLDPDVAVPWPRVVESAWQLKDFFDDLRLQSFLKTTGGKGLHIVLPLARMHEWPEVAAFCKAVADAVAGNDSARYTSRPTKSARQGKIYLDYLRNRRGATAIAPYSTRARPGAPVAVPIAWRELNDQLRSDQFNVENVPERLRSLRQDPWHGIGQVRQSITASVKRKLGLL